MRRILFLIAASHLVMVTCLYSQAGQTGLSFLKLGVGGRSLGMGEAAAAVSSDPTATYYNPSMLTLSTRPQLIVMHREWIQGVRTEFLGGSMSFGDLALGFHLNSTNVSDIELRQIPGPAIGTFGSHDASIGLSAALPVGGGLAIGVTGSYLFEKIYTDETTGFGFDIGANYLTPWNIRLAAVVSNLGSMQTLQAEAPTLPRSFRFGAGYSAPVESIDGTFTLASDVVSVSGDGTTHVDIGGELDYQKSFAVRAGYQTGYDSRGFSAGAGIRYNVFSFDYAYAPFRDDFGGTHTLSLGVTFE